MGNDCMGNRLFCPTLPAFSAEQVRRYGIARDLLRGRIAEYSARIARADGGDVHRLEIEQESMTARLAELSVSDPNKIESIMREYSKTESREGQQ